MMDNEPRPVPQHIDNRGRLVEYVIAFMLPIVLVRPFFEGLGFVLAIILPLAYAKATLGKPAGYLQHLCYRCGLPMPGLINRKITRLRR